MGLDAVELLLEIEDRFGITIRDDEAQNVCTVGDLLAIVRARVANSTRAGCPQLQAFLRVRQTLREFLDEPHRRMRPSSTVASLVPIRRRAEFWRKLAELLEYTLPPLRYPPVLRFTLVATAVVFLVLGLSTAKVDIAILPLGLLGAVAAIIVMYLCTAPLRTEPAASLLTLGDVTQRLVGLTVATQPMSDDGTLYEGLRTIIVEQLGVRPDRVVPEARFVQDLGMN